MPKTLLIILLPLLLSINSSYRNSLHGVEQSNDRALRIQNDDIPNFYVPKTEELITEEEEDFTPITFKDFHRSIGGRALDIIEKVERQIYNRKADERALFWLASINYLLDFYPKPNHNALLAMVKNLASALEVGMEGENSSKLKITIKTKLAASLKTHPENPFLLISMAEYHKETNNRKAALITIEQLTNKGLNAATKKHILQLELKIRTPKTIGGYLYPEEMAHYRSDYLFLAQGYESLWKTRLENEDRSNWLADALMNYSNAEEYERAVTLIAKAKNEKAIPEDMELFFNGHVALGKFYKLRGTLKEKRPQLWHTCKKDWLALIEKSEGHRLTSYYSKVAWRFESKYNNHLAADEMRPGQMEIYQNLVQLAMAALTDKSSITDPTYHTALLAIQDERQLLIADGTLHSAIIPAITADQYATAKFEKFIKTHAEKFGEPFLQELLGVGVSNMGRHSFIDPPNNLIITLPEESMSEFLKIVEKQ